MAPYVGMRRPGVGLPLLAPVHGFMIWLMDVMEDM